jgi:Flp pilus assembly protein TadG
MKRHTKTHSERGTAIVEFTLTAAVFLMMIVGIVSAGHLFFTYNAMVESTRRGARYAATLPKPTTETCQNNSTTIDPRIKNMVLYGTTTAGTTTLVNNLQASNITVCYSSDYGVAQGTVSVKIESYTYRFALGKVISMPAYQTTVMGESAGWTPEVACP